MAKSPVQFTTATENPDIPGITDIAPQELSEKATSVHMVDVRRADEFTGELGHIGGAKHLVLDTLPETLDTLPKNEPIVFVCRSGGRSARATALAIEHGFTQVFNMKGGMLLWNSLGLPVER